MVMEMLPPLPSRISQNIGGAFFEDWMFPFEVLERRVGGGVWNCRRFRFALRAADRQNTGKNTCYEAVSISLKFEHGIISVATR